MDPLNDRTISLQNFINDRSVEIQHFSNLLKQKTCFKKVRLIPKSIRRRAMSHNRYRIPLRQRAAIEKDLKTIQSMQKIPRCRKTIRKKHLLIKQYRKRCGKTKWLGNHLWSAKRMRMVQYFGYKVGMNPNDKSDRACYRYSRYGCCLMNLSFYQILRIDVKQQQNIQIIKKYFYNIPAKQSEFVDTYLSINQSLVCPVMIYKNRLEYYVYYHPAARKEVESILIPEYQLQIIENRMEIYRLIGPESIEKLNLLLDNIGYQSPSNSLISQFKVNNNPNYYDNNLTMSVDITNCKYENKLILAPTKAITQYIKDDYESPKHIDSNNIDMICEEVSNESFWKNIFINHQQQGRLQFSTRSKYTHRRKNKMSKEDKQKMMKQNPLLNSNTKKQKEKMVEEKVEVIYEVKEPKKDKIIPERRILISLINNNKDTDGCLLMFSNFDFSYIWRKLSFLNCKVIGLHQYETILNQNFERVYPKDYPGTQGFQNLISTNVSEEILKYRKRPPSKVPHYRGMNSPFPFGINLKSFNSYTSPQYKLKQLKCISVGRGSIPSNSLLYTPTKDDIAKFKQLLNKGQPISYLHQEEEQQIQRISRKQLLKMSNQEVEEYFMGAKTDRELVGFITAGGINLKMAKGYGIGVVKQEYDLPYILVRKPTSPLYFLAQVIQQ